jgi:hypothetical protein
LLAIQKEIELRNNNSFQMDDTMDLFANIPQQQIGSRKTGKSRLDDKSFSRQSTKQNTYSIND